MSNQCRCTSAAHVVEPKLEITTAEVLEQDGRKSSEGLSRMDRRSLILGGVAFAASGSAAFSEAREIRYNFKSAYANNGTFSKRYRGKKRVKYSTRERPGTIVISTRERALYFVLNNREAIRYGVGVGRQGFSWTGVASIKRKAEWPSWHPPKEMIERELKQYGRRIPDFMPGGPENPLGARALYLYQGSKDTLYRIHGTNRPGSIGLAVSSGCIRMLNNEVVDLYNRVNYGAKVVVI